MIGEDETLKQPLASGLEVVEDNASGGATTRPLLPPVYVEKGYITALREVLEIIEEEKKYSPDWGSDQEGEFACDADALIAKLTAMIEGENEPS